MSVYRHKLLHWLLVITLATLPLRATFAIPSCNIHDSAMHHSETSAMSDHGVHKVRMMQHDADMAADNTTQMHACCCCDDGTRCNSDCGMGLHAPAILQSAPAVAGNSLPLLLIETSANLHTLIQTPPSRPPLPLHI